MEFSFEYTELLRIINENRSITYSVAYVGILLCYFPIRLAVNILGLKLDGKVHVVATIYVVATWFIGLVLMGSLSSAYPSGLKVFLVWAIMALVNLYFAIANASLIYKAYHGLEEKVLNKSK